MRAIIEAAQDIEELSIDLDNISADDRKAVEDYTDEEIVREARYVLSLFVDPAETHFNAEDYRGENGYDRQRWARGEVRKLKALIKRFG
jgi:hypothetical protein